jgi:hypothetical protein
MQVELLPFLPIIAIGVCTNKLLKKGPKMNFCISAISAGPLATTGILAATLKDPHSGVCADGLGLGSGRREHDRPLV